MVEAVHLLGTHTVCKGIAVPALPYRGGAVVNRVHPAWILVLEEKFVGDIGHSVVGESLHKDGGAKETGLEAVVVVFEVLSQPCDHILLCLALYQVVLQGEESRGLHSIQNRKLEAAVRKQEAALEICLGLRFHLLEALGRTSCDLGHLGHHTGIHSPVAGAEVVPVLNGLGEQAL